MNAALSLTTLDLSKRPNMADANDTEKPCALCGISYKKSKTMSRRYWIDTSRYCSLRCAKLGKPAWNKGRRDLKPSWNSGRASPETSGPNNPAWKGTDAKYFRNLALKRDDYTCRICGLREPDIMQVDHIKPESQSPELARSITNLQTLCPNCHARKTIAELRSGISHRSRVNRL